MDFERERISDKLSGIQTFKDLFPSICISWSNKRYSLLHKLQGLCAWKSASLFWYLSVTLTANLTSYSFDLHLPSRPLNIMVKHHYFHLAGRKTCLQQWCDSQQEQEYAVDPRACLIQCSMLLQPGSGDWSFLSALCDGYEVVPWVWTFFLTISGHWCRAGKEPQYWPQYPTHSFLNAWLFGSLVL